MIFVGGLNDCREAGGTKPRMAEGTTPWMEEVEQRRTQLPRTMQEQLSRVTQDNSMDGIGRVASGTKTEQLPSAAEPTLLVCWSVISFLEPTL